jgi:hypothetical protein
MPSCGMSRAWLAGTHPRHNYDAPDVKSGVGHAIRTVLDARAVPVVELDPLL